MATIGRDRYGRTVATLVVDQQDLGLALLHAGLAWYDRRYAYPRLAELTGQYDGAQQFATLTFKGLWAELRQMAPWLWRAGGRQVRVGSRCVNQTTHAGDLNDSGR